MVFKLCITLVIIVELVNSAPSDLIINFFGAGTCNDNGKTPCGGNVVTPKIPSGYEKFASSYYKYHRQPLLFHQARSTCEAEGGYLTVINSEEESYFLVGLMNRYPANVLNDVVHKDYILIGFHDFFKEGEYVTIQGNSLENSGFTRWAGGQPDNAGGNENCGSLHRSGGLNDYPCSVPSPFVCEFTLTNCSRFSAMRTQRIRIKRPRIVRIFERKDEVHILSKNYLNLTNEYIISGLNCLKIKPNFLVSISTVSTTTEILTSTSKATTQFPSSTIKSTSDMRINTSKSTTMMPRNITESTTLLSTSITHSTTEIFTRNLISTLKLNTEMLTDNVKSTAEMPTDAINQELFTNNTTTATKTSTSSSKTTIEIPTSKSGLTESTTSTTMKEFNIDIRYGIKNSTFEPVQIENDEIQFLEVPAE